MKIKTRIGENKIEINIPGTVNYNGTPIGYYWQAKDIIEHLVVIEFSSY